MSQMGFDVNQLVIINYPHPVLRRKAQPVPQVDQAVRAVAARMLALMHEAPGVGLAAPQIGLPWRLFVANATGEAGDDMVFVNPVLTDPSGEVEVAEEGCLSLPEVRGQIRRPRQITVEATDLEGRRFTATSDELPARIWQHETDHLEGVLIIDKMPQVDRLANQRLLRDMERAFDGRRR